MFWTCRRGQRTGDHGPDELGDQLTLHHVSQPDGNAGLDARRLRADVTRREEGRQQPVDVASNPSPLSTARRQMVSRRVRLLFPAPFGPTTNVTRSLSPSPNWSKDSTPAPDSEVIRTRRV
jgi:hypothetical protein